MSMNIPVGWMASVGYDKYNIDENKGEDDASSKDIEE